MDRPRRRLRPVALVRALTDATSGVDRVNDVLLSGSAIGAPATIVEAVGDLTRTVHRPRRSTSTDELAAHERDALEAQPADPLGDRSGARCSREFRMSGSKRSIVRRNSSGDAAAHACGEHDVG